MAQFWQATTMEWSSKDSRYNAHTRWRIIFGHSDDVKGTKAEFKHDQDHSTLGKWIFEKQVSMEHLKEFMNSPDLELKGNTVQAYVYK